MISIGRRIIGKSWFFWDASDDGRAFDMGWEYPAGWSLVLSGWIKFSDPIELKIERIKIERYLRKIVSALIFHRFSVVLTGWLKETKPSQGERMTRLSIFHPYLAAVICVQQLALSSMSCPVDHSSASSNQSSDCPVDHSSRSTWSDIFKSPSQSTASSTSAQTPAGLSSARETSSIPHTTSENWVYPSEAQFFAAMERKNHNPQSADMKTIVPIHNAVNERAWGEVMGWE